jgi:3-dehydroquinate dehydratase II
MKIMVLNGPNLNMLGKRDEKHYGDISLEDINSHLTGYAEEDGTQLKFYQSNHEGELIDFIQENATDADGIIINPGALTHYGYSLRDALIDSKLPIVEVHLSDISNREDFRKINVLDGIVIGRVMGKKVGSYVDGLDMIRDHIYKHRNI